MICDGRGRSQVIISIQSSTRFENLVVFKLPDHRSYSRYHAGHWVVKDNQGTVLALKDSPMPLALAFLPFKCCPSHAIESNRDWSGLYTTIKCRLGQTIFQKSSLIIESARTSFGMFLDEHHYLSLRCNHGSQWVIIDNSPMETKMTDTAEALQLSLPRNHQ